MPPVSSSFHVKLCHKKIKIKMVSTETSFLSIKQPNKSHYNTDVMFARLTMTEPKLQTATCSLNCRRTSQVNGFRIYCVICKKDKFSYLNYLFILIHTFMTIHIYLPAEESYKIRFTHIICSYTPYNQLHSF